MPISNDNIRNEARDEGNCARVGVFRRASEELTGPVEISVEGNRIVSIGRSVNRPRGAQVIDLSDRTVTPGFIDTHVHLTMDSGSADA